MTKVFVEPRDAPIDDSIAVTVTDVEPASRVRLIEIPLEHFAKRSNGGAADPRWAPRE